MHLFNEQLTQFLSFPRASIYPANTATGTSYVGGGNTGIDMSIFRRVMGHIIVGVIGAGNAQAYFVASANANMVGNTNVSATNVTSTLLNTANTETTLECRADQLPAGTRYVAMAVLVGGNAINLAASVIAADASYSPGNQYDANSTYIATRVVL